MLREWAWGPDHNPRGVYPVSILLIERAFNKGKADVRDAAARLRKDRDDADRRVTGFLQSGWTGVAAESFVEAWGDWKVAATDVLDGLVAMAELLDAAQADFVAQDEASQARLDTISAQIIERLGP